MAGRANNAPSEVAADELTRQSVRAEAVADANDAG